jgi:hypothetical protein
MWGTNEQNPQEYARHQPDAASAGPGLEIGLQTRLGCFSAILGLTPSRHAMFAKQKTINSLTEMTRSFRFKPPEPLEPDDDDEEKNNLVPSIHRTLITSLVLKKPSFF